MKTKLEVTGVKPFNPDEVIIGFAVCRQWRDNPKNVEVYDYASSRAEAKEMISGLPKNETLYRWFVGVYQ